ncbi:hypothetical protein [Hymenobacter metallicola]|uniref:Tail fiber protein n=1 Tax=Hymenobacter metallicola TaxID=2563114 RepID=A0A4Z0Q1K1_9BACT|nr:hypothetical protein [Hymenobacter metallicola]TGE23565.1 hypothetical protein E5K02_20480 [Hymenobacter metallicola]
MKYVKFESGGRPWANDDLDVLQDEVYAAIQSTLQGAPPMVLSGCKAEQPVPGFGSISPGFIWLAGNIQRYDGASDVTFPAEIIAGEYVDTDFRAYQTGGSKACMTEREFITQPAGTAAADVARITFISGPELTYWKYIESKTRYVGEVQMLAIFDSRHYDNTGKGWTDLDTRGWALCNGQNGTADLRERFVVGMHPQANDYSQPGKTGGAAQVKIEVEHMPAHTHDVGRAGKHRHKQERNTKSTSSEKASATRSGNPEFDGNYLDTSEAGEHTHELAETGGGQLHENRPPFYVLAFRQWIGF